jgi:hypothetical protein
MKFLWILFCLPVFVLGTYVKNDTRISINKKGRQAFANLKDSTYVGQSIIKDRVWIELYGFVKMEDFKNKNIEWIDKLVKYDNSGKLWPSRELRIKDTIKLYSDTLFKNWIGKAWPVPDTEWITIDTANPIEYKKIGPFNFLTFHLYGVTDSSAIIEFQPWLNRLQSLHKKSGLFGASIDSIKSIMKKEGQTREIETDKGISYYRITDESTPNSINEAILFVTDRKVCAIWTTRKFGKDFIQLKDGYFYYDQNVKSKAQQFKKTIIKILEYTE